MASISSPGIGSKLDVNSLVSQVMDAERAPSTRRFTLREAEIQAKISSFGAIKSALSTFQGTLTKLGSVSTFQGKLADTGGSTAFSATPSSIADSGSYSVEVLQLAQSHSLVTAAGEFSELDDEVGSGTLTFSFGTTDYTPADDPTPESYDSFTEDADKVSRSVEIAAGSTLEEVRDAVNDAGVGVKASIIDDGNGYRLSFVTEDNGEGNSLEITVDEGGDPADNIDTTGLSRLAFNIDATNMDQTAAAQDAQLKIDGLTISRESNTVSSAIHGVTLNLTQVSASGAETLNITQNSETPVAVIKEFVEAYNGAINSLHSSSAYAPDGGSGVLLGDSAVRGAERQIRQAMSTVLTGVGGGFKTLSEVGITIERDGSIKLNESALSDAVKTDVGKVGDLFQAFSSDIDSVIDGMLDKSEGVIESRLSGLGEQMINLNADRARTDARLSSMEARLYSQFSALDVLVAQMQTTSDYLAGQLANLPTIGGNNK